MDWELLANVSTALGLPALFVTLLIEGNRSADERARQTQLELSQRYAAFLEMAMEHPELQLSDLLGPAQVPVVMPSADLQYRKQVAMITLVSLFEDAHFLLGASRNRLRRNAWAGWEDYIAYWMQRPDFRQAWHAHYDSQFNAGFMAYMKQRWPSLPGDPAAGAVTQPGNAPPRD